MNNKIYKPNRHEACAFDRMYKMDQRNFFFVASNFYKYIHIHEMEKHTIIIIIEKSDYIFCIYDINIMEN